MLNTLAAIFQWLAAAFQGLANRLSPPVQNIGGPDGDPPPPP